jgi:hypothetical protein
VNSFSWLVMIGSKDVSKAFGYLCMMLEREREREFVCARPCVFSMSFGGSKSDYEKINYD